MEETRKFVRIDWPVLVQYKTLEEPFTKDEIIGKNVSEGGVSFIVYERLLKGTKLDMQIQTPFDSLPIFSKAKVSWIRNVGEEHEKKFEIGVEFTKVDPKDTTRLKKYIDNEIKQRKIRNY
ncbi:MAG: PilZ domain-containing protein [Candidatus Omnitrophica bacterium]|nr:PilZ domain-containing protein [Candidatus Omnitrophota bacterium]